MSKISLLMSAVDNISPATKAAAKSQESLANELMKTRKEASENNAVLKNTYSYEKQVSAVGKANAAYARYSKQLEAQKNSINKNRKPSLEQINNIAELEQKTEDARIALRDKTRTLERLGARLKSAGVDTDNLSKSQDDLTARSEAYNQEIKRKTASIRELNSKVEQGQKSDLDNQKKLLKLEKDRAKARSELIQGGIDRVTDGVATGAKVGAGITTAAVLSSAAHEKSYASVKGGTNWSDSQHKANMAWALDYSASKASGGASVNTIHTIQAAAAKGGNKDLESNQEATQNIIKMMEVFKVEDASRATWLYNRYANGLNLGNDGSFSKMGLLSELNKVAGANPEDFLEELAEITAKTKGAGWEFNKTAALTTAFVGGNVTTSEANSAIMAISERIALGDAAPKAMKEAYAMIGINPNEAAKQSHTDPTGLILEIVKRIQTFKPEKRQDLIDQFFGEGMESIRPLVNDPQVMDRYNQAMEIASKSDSDHSQSLNKRYDDQSGTGIDHAQVFFNSLQRLAVIVGEPLQDPLKRLGSEAIDVANGFGDVARKNPEIAALLVSFTLVAGGLVTLKKTLDALNSFKAKLRIAAGVVNVTEGVSGVNSDISSSKSEKGKQTKKRRGLPDFADLGAVGLGLSMIPDFSPIDIARTKAIDSDLLPEGARLSVGLLDVFDEVKGFFLGGKTPEIPASSAVIPTPSQAFEAETKAKAAEAVIIEQARSSARTTTVNLNLNLSGQVDGLSPEAKADIVEAVKSQVAGVGGVSLYDREDY